MRGILHIGTEKTGSTLLQKWLYSNQKNLSNQGIYLSNILGIPNNFYFPINLNGKFEKKNFLNLIRCKKKNIKNIADKNAHFVHFKSKLSEETKFASKNHDVFIITSELLHSRIIDSKDVKKIKIFKDNRG